MDAIPRAVEVRVRACANGVSSGASTQYENGRYYIAVEPGRAAMALLLVTGGVLGWWSLWSTSRARAGRQTGSSSSSGQCETRSAIICSMQASRGVGHGYGSALTTIQSEGGYIESAIYGSAREGDAAQAGAGWRYSCGHRETAKPHRLDRHSGTSSQPVERESASSSPKASWPGSDGPSRTHGAR